MSWPNDTIDAGTIKRKINKNYMEYHFLTRNLELTYSNLLFREIEFHNSNYETLHAKDELYVI
jgi:hypothetical protein